MAHYAISGATIMLLGSEFGTESVMTNTALMQCCREARSEAAELVTCSMLAPSCPTETLDESQRQRVYREFCEKVDERRMASIGVIMRSRGRLAPAMEARSMSSSCLFELELPVAYSNLGDAQRMVGIFQQIYVTMGRLVAAMKPARRRRGRPEPSVGDLRRDLRIAEAWATGHFLRYAKLGREMGLSAGEVRQALDRHRKRRGRQLGLDAVPQEC